jgi:hypothetical protein
MRKWVNVELEREEADCFRKYLRSKDIKFETSGAGHLTHFECYMTPEEIKDADGMLEGI